MNIRSASLHRGRQFAERDRLQAACSIAVVPVQTGREGGTLHTVRFGRELQRAVLVPRPLPGEVSRAVYEGIEDLIASGRVGVVEGHADYQALAPYRRTHLNWLLAPGGTPAPIPANGARSPDDVQTSDDGDAQQLGLFVPESDPERRR